MMAREKKKTNPQEETKSNNEDTYHKKWWNLEKEDVLKPPRLMEIGEVQNPVEDPSHKWDQGIGPQTFALGLLTNRSENKEEVYL
ncbi:hypothetical protein RIF29_00629 [Crotalaria pallida]|uniref:Uncharacterized protein n=1 Tax=Crotalaria pallida TaxID=3830 RepID=A0AAN9P745_CROPI